MSDRLIARLRATLEDVTADEQGQGLVEYALILLLVAIACVITLTALGVAVAPFFQNAANAL